ncbi:SpoIID/LytB domain-containing protein [Halothermothrix orenii]|uniref:SpoIID/LytB domain protein n=1 Tax=Halothermothrix orenii (strain H 168 / OCM 544 / DSM 9562) TaxID=373903 RepID=B8D008_HALOH|nr:SpoIID/LytB domain-containing protein [Halothermothrix orenii]ACL70860.1 SpoIID/LytB domain protein [Halothermothrix orenii H 168]
MPSQFYRRVIVLMVLFLSLLVLTLTGCEQNQDQVKGIRDRQKFESEPRITVKLPGLTKTMPLEQYVTGVVAGEMKKDWPQNAYGAQAIIARTFALQYMEANNTDTISGEFEYAQEYKPENITETIRKAVEETRGEVALYKDDYIKAWFHASAGGQTTTARVGLAYEKEEPPYIKSVKSPDDEAPADVRNWTTSFSRNEIEKALESLGKSVGDLKNVEIKNKDKTGRVIEFKVSGSKKGVSVKAPELRVALDPKKLKSTKITELKKEGDKYIFKGSGFGHGVGMSQWGAYSMARDGKSAEEIVKYYFKDIEIARVYD